MLIKNYLNADSLIKEVRTFFSTLKDRRSDNASISLTDALMSGFAMFSLKMPSLLAFENNTPEYAPNLKAVYGIQKIPSDTNLRIILDGVNPSAIKAGFKICFDHLQRSNILQQYLYLNHYYIIALDGVEFFNSKTVCCIQCLERKLKDGSIQYYHQMVAAVIVHPNKREVIPLAPEMIVRQDGSSKNDVERNAVKRLLPQIRQAHPKMKIIITEDGLSSNAPHIKELQKHDFRFILGAKPDDHKYLFAQVANMQQLGRVTEKTIIKDEITHIFHYINDLPLNESNTDVRVNFLEHWEINNKTNKTQHFTWVTDFKLDKKNVFDIMRGGRARWKIENETFNTLKNQDYHFEHNYGHGQKNLSSVFALTMMLTFSVDQALQISCNLFNAAKQKCGSKTNFWQRVRSYFITMLFDSMNQIYEAILYGIEKHKPIIKYTKRQKPVKYEDTT